ncbi:MAG: TrmO family methyltransferase [Chloroflexota bacterium]|nr:TrmO family methyltransferase [Chloroflexota bacterium]
MARVVALCRSERRMDPKEDIGAGELRAGHGLVGDAHAGLSEREVSLLALESIERINRERGIGAGPGDFAENLTTQGVDLSSLRMGDRLRVGEALLEVVQIGKPPSATHTYSFQSVSILPAEGIFCRVLEGGRVRRGDEIIVTPGEILFQPIGHVENDFHHPAPPEEIRRHRSRIILDEEFAEGLEGLRAGDRLTVVFHFHLSQGYDLLQHPHGDRSRPKRGVFTLCSPRRPNPIGVSFVDLIEREGRTLTVRGLDALNGTPLLDIKPFIGRKS